MSEIPHKLFYKIGEVCQYTDTQPYVLRFWESEFPNLAPEKNRSGQRVYRRDDIELILRIKKLLYDEEYTIAGARKRLEEETLGTNDESWNEGKPAGRRQELPYGARGAVEAEPSEAPPAAKVVAGLFAGLIGETGAVEVRSGEHDSELEGARASIVVGEDTRKPSDDGTAELERLRQRLAEANESSKRAEERRAQSERSAEAYRARCERVAVRLEEILALLPEKPPVPRGHP